MKKKEKIGDSYDMIVQEIQNVCDRNCLEPEKIEKIDELCLYFGSTYIKSLVPNREVSNREVSFPTNAAEGCHFGIQSYFSGAHPNMWKVVGSLQKDASVQKLNSFDASSGHKFTKKKKYRVLNERVQNIMSVYEDKTDLYFFRALSSLCYTIVNFISFLFILSYY